MLLCQYFKTGMDQKYTMCFTTNKFYIDCSYQVFYLENSSHEADQSQLVLTLASNACLNI